MWAIRNGLQSLGSNFVENGSDYTMLEFFFIGIFGLALDFFVMEKSGGGVLPFPLQLCPRKLVHDRLRNSKQKQISLQKTYQAHKSFPHNQSITLFQFQYTFYLT